MERIEVRSRNYRHTDRGLSAEERQKQREEEQARREEEQAQREERIKRDREEAEARRAKMKADAERMRRENEEAMERAKEKQREMQAKIEQQRKESAQRQAEIRKKLNQGKGFDPKLFETDSNPFGSGASKSNQPAGASKPGGGTPGSVSEFMQTLAFGQADGKLRLGAIKNWNDGKRAAGKALGSDSFKSGFRLSEIAGSDSKTASLMYDSASPVESVESVKLSGPIFVPLFGQQDASDQAIDCSSSALQGFNVAFDGEQVVGLQASFGDDDSSHWIGSSSGNIQELRAAGAVHGFVCYLKGSQIVGFALVEKSN